MGQLYAHNISSITNTSSSKTINSAVAELEKISHSHIFMTIVNLHEKLTISLLAVAGMGLGSSRVGPFSPTKCRLQI